MEMDYNLKMFSERFTPSLNFAVHPCPSFARFCESRISSYGIFLFVFQEHSVCKRRHLRTFALIVSAHPYCARNSLPRHALSARAVGEMWRYIALVGTLVSVHGFNSLKCSVTPYFLLINHFLCQLSTF